MAVSKPTSASRSHIRASVSRATPARPERRSGDTGSQFAGNGFAEAGPYGPLRLLDPQLCAGGHHDGGPAEAAVAVDEAVERGPLVGRERHDGCPRIATVLG